MSRPGNVKVSPYSRQAVNVGLRPSFPSRRALTEWCRGEVDVLSEKGELVHLAEAMKLHPLGGQDAFDDPRGQRSGPEPVGGGPGVSVRVRLVVRLKELPRVNAVGHHANPASRNCDRAPRDEPLGPHAVTTASPKAEAQPKCPEPNLLIDQPAPLRSAECDQLIEHRLGLGPPRPQSRGT